MHHDDDNLAIDPLITGTAKAARPMPTTAELDAMLLAIQQAETAKTNA